MLIFHTELISELIPSDGLSLNSFLRGLIGIISILFITFLISSNKKNFPLKRFLDSNASWPYRLAKLSIKSNKRYIWLSTIHCEKYDNNIQVNIDKYSYSSDNISIEKLNGKQFF